jgi:hypothetical protein
MSISLRGVGEPSLSVLENTFWGQSMLENNLQVASKQTPLKMIIQHQHGAVRNDDTPQWILKKVVRKIKSFLLSIWSIFWLRTHTFFRPLSALEPEPVPKRPNSHSIEQIFSNQNTPSLLISNQNSIIDIQKLSFSCEFDPNLMNDNTHSENNNNSFNDDVYYFNSSIDNVDIVDYFN